jgi:opacity protein-like surface antigen
MALILLASPAMAGSPLLEEAQLPELDSPWSFEFTPYLWAADIEGTVGVGGITSAVDVGFGDILDNLDMAFAAHAGVRYNRFGLNVDLSYLEISPSFETPGPLFKRTDLRVKSTLLDLKGFYRLYETERAWLNLSAGARYFDQDISLQLQPGLLAGRSASAGEGWWDAIVGFRGQYALTEKWFLTYMADIGGGSSDLTWQALGGIGYRFNENVHASVVYRYTSYDYSSDDFTYDTNTEGIGVGVGFSW